jgi:hypothetical protein
MTLILALLNRDQAVLASDRRVTHDGRLVDANDDEYDKTAIVTFEDARLAVAFTGLAKQDASLTNEWLLRALFEATRQLA